MAANRRQVALLAGLVVLLAVLIWFDWPQILAGGGRTGSGTAAPAASRGPQGPSSQRTVADVGLGALDEAVPAPADSGRNPFRFAARAPEEPEPGVGGVEPPPVMPPLAPPPPQGPPPIPLRFIGLVDAPGQTARLAVLSDGRNVFHGREGDIIDGRYRIVRIGVESIEMSYVDGRGRQTIRLSGAG